MASVLLVGDGWYVYYLSDPESGELLYIGRSKDPEVRLKAHIRRFGRPLVMRFARRCETLREARWLELDEIRAHWPPLNKTATSSPGNEGNRASPETRAKMSASHKKAWREKTRTLPAPEVARRPKTPEHRERIRQALVGRPHSEERRLNISLAKQARKRSDG